MPKLQSLSRSFLFMPETTGDTNQLLDNFYNALSLHVPADLMVIYSYDYATNFMFLYSLVTEQGPMLYHERRKISHDAIVEYRRIFKSKLHIFQTENSPAAQDFLTEFPIPLPFSAVNVHMQMRQRTYAALGLCFSGKESINAHYLDFLKNNYDQILVGLRYVISQLENVSLMDYLGTPWIVGVDSGLKKTMDLVKQVSYLNSTVLVTGETGVGKEVIANEVYRRSPRSEKPFFAINCGSIPETLIDSELFGYEKGAFTGAHCLKEGIFEQADGGVLFLDEIGELSLAAQAKLLRFLQTKEFYRVGGRRLLSVDVRIIAATNRDLRKMVKTGQFRSDLWFRINVFPIHVPPLRERKADIPSLATYFARLKSRELAIPWPATFASEAMSQLQAYDWPGNVRELQNIIERHLIICQGKPLSFRHLHLSPGRYSDGEVSITQYSADTFLPLQDMMRMHIKQGLLLAKGRIEGTGGAADLLGLSPSTLRAKIKKLDIKRDLDGT